MQINNSENNETPTAAPILSLQRDRRMGKSSGGWALYQTPSGWVYAGNATDGDEEYIIPIRSELIRTFRFIAARGKNNSIIEQLEEMLEVSAEESTPDDADDPESDEIDPQEYANDLLLLVPASDRVWAVGPDATAFASANGIPYFIHEDFCICCSTAPYTMAYSLLKQGETAEVETTFSEDGTACFLVTQGNVSLHFYVCHEDISKKVLSDENCVYVTPIALRGRQNGRLIQIEI